MWPADHSAHPFYYPAILTDVSPHRPQSVRPCHIFPAFSPRQPPASSIPPCIPAQHHLRIRLTRSRTATASTVRCMPGCPHLHIAAFIAARQTLLPVPDNPRRTQASSVFHPPPSSNTENGRVLAAISALTRRTRAKSDCTNTLCSRDILKYPLYSCICSQWQPMARPGAMGCPQCMSACVKTRHAARRSHKLAQYIAPAALQTLLQAESRLFRHVQLAHKINTKIFFQI